MATRRRKILLSLVILFCLTLIYLVIEHVRGRWALAAWEKTALARGEKLDISALAPPLPPGEKNGASSFLQAVVPLSSGTGLDGLIFFPSTTPGKVVAVLQLEDVRGVLQNYHFPSNQLNWASVTADFNANAGALAQLLASIHQGLLNFNVDYGRDLQVPLYPLSQFKSASRWLASAAVVEWHSGHRDAALELLLDAIALTSLQDEPMLVGQLVRINCVQIIQNATWQLLQSPDWTDSQLTRLQQAWASCPLAEGILNAWMMDRAMVRLEYDRCRRNPVRLLDTIDDTAGLFPKGSYWLLEEIDSATEPVRSGLREHVYGPLWSFAWADQDELKFLQESQQYLDRARVALRQRSLAAGSFPPEALSPGTRAAAREKRGFRHPLYSYVMSEFSGYFLTRAFHTDALREITVTAIALKRHHLRTGHYPASLSTLVPDLLAQPPLDPMDGQPLRYRLPENGQFLLYSIGTDLKDDGGDPTLPESIKVLNQMNGRDLVWPWPATPEEIADFIIRQTKSAPKTK